MRSTAAKLKEIPLGEEGIAYVASCLRQGRGLCSRILEVSFLDGAAFAPLPEGVSLERAKKFDVGGLTSRRDVMPWLVEHVRNLCRGKATGGLIFQDLWAKPNDSIANNSSLNPLCQDSNVYYYLEKAEVNIYSVTQILRAMESYLFMAMYSRYSPLNGEIPPGGFINEGIIDNLARNTVQIFAGAYDLEGLVVWRK